MARSKATSIFSTIDHVYDNRGPCRVYITGADEVDKQGRSLWFCYFAIDGGKQKQLIRSAPLRWREAAHLADRLNRAAGLIPEPTEVAEEVAS